MSGDLYQHYKGELEMNINNDFGRFLILMIFSMMSFCVKPQVMGKHLIPENGNAFVVENNDGTEYCVASYLNGFKDGMVSIETCPPPFSLLEERNWFYTDAGQIVSVVSDFSTNDAYAYTCLTKGESNLVKIELCDMNSMEQKFELKKDYDDKLVISMKNTNLVFGIYQGVLSFQAKTNLNTPLYIKPSSITASDEDEALESGLTSLLFSSPISPVYQYATDLKLDNGRYLTWDSNLWAKFLTSKSSQLYYDVLNQRLIGYDRDRGFLCLENNANPDNWNWSKFSSCSLIGDNNLSQQVIFAVTGDLDNAILSPVNNAFDYKMYYDNSGQNEYFAYFSKKGYSTSGGDDNIYLSSPSLTTYADAVGTCSDSGCSNLNYNQVDSYLDENLIVLKKDVYIKDEGVCEAKAQQKSPPTNNLKLDYTQIKPSDLKPLLTGQSRIYWLNSGQGTTIVVDTYGGDPIIIDAGSVQRGNELNNEHNERQMTHQQTTQLVRDIVGNRQATVIISHPDTDHYNLLPQIFDTSAATPAVPYPSRIYIGGMYTDYQRLNTWFQTLIQNGTSVFDNIQLNNPVVNQITTTERNNMGMQTNVVLQNDVLPNGIGNMYLLTSSPRATNSNERSLTVMYQSNDFQTFFMADATGVTETDLLQNYGRMQLPNTLNGIFTASHHGANTHGSNSLNLIGFLAPAISIIQHGASSYQHPRKSTWDRLALTCAMAAGFAMDLHQYYNYDETSTTMQSPDSLTSDPVFSTQENGSFIATITPPGAQRVPPSGTTSQPNPTVNTYVDFVALPNGNSNEVTQSSQTMSNNAKQQQQFP